MINVRTIVIAVFTAALLSTPAHAQRARKDDDERATKQTVAMSQDVYKALQEAQLMAEDKNYGEALRALEKVRGKKNLSPYEQAQIWNLTAYTYYQQERYPDAIRAYENVLSQPELPEALVQSTLKTVSQLYFTTENYRKALETVKRLMAVLDDPSPDVYMLLGQAHFQLKEYDQALTPIRTGIDKYRAQGKTPKENWLLLLRVIYYEKQDYRAMIDVLKELLQYYPKDSYLLTLAGAYSELGETKKQLVLTEALYDAGVLTGSQHVVNLANLYLMHGIPFKAAKLLDTGLDSGVIETNERHLRLLSQSWYQAREDEKSIPPLARAAQMSGDGELYVRLAQSYVNLEKWSEAIDALQQGLRLGGVKRPDTANVMLGMAYFNQQKLRSARDAFQAALSDQRSERVARQWIAHVDREIERNALLDQKAPTIEQREIDPLLRQNQDDQTG